MNILLLTVLTTCCSLPVRVRSTVSFPVYDSSKIHVQRIKDFAISAEAISPVWKKVEWTTLSQHASASGMYNTRVKTAYSAKGMYFLFECPDRKLTATFDHDQEPLWTEDVAELFLWPDQRSSDYFEYEISPLNHQLALLVSNNANDTVRWQPFLTNAAQRTSHEVHVTGGKQQSGGAVTAWTAEIFIPFRLLRPLNNNIPSPGTEWRANFYRVDYDNDNDPSDWSWKPVKKSYHEYQQFGYLVFE